MVNILPTEKEVGTVFKKISAIEYSVQRQVQYTVHKSTKQSTLLYSTKYTDY